MAHQGSRSGDDPGELGLWLLRQRQERKLVLREVQAGSGISCSLLSRLEKGKYKNPTIDTLARLALYFEVRLGELAEMAGRDLMSAKRLNVEIPYDKRFAARNRRIGGR